MEALGNDRPNNHKFPKCNDDLVHFSLAQRRKYPGSPPELSECQDLPKPAKPRLSARLVLESWDVTGCTGVFTGCFSIGCMGQVKNTQGKGLRRKPKELKHTGMFHALVCVYIYIYIHFRV